MGSAKKPHRKNSSILPVFLLKGTLYPSPHQPFSKALINKQMSVQIKKKNHFLRVNAAISLSSRIRGTAHTVNTPDEQFPDGRKVPLPTSPSLMLLKQGCSHDKKHQSLMRGEPRGSNPASPFQSVLFVVTTILSPSKKSTMSGISVSKNFFIFFKRFTSICLTRSREISKLSAIF